MRHVLQEKGPVTKKEIVKQIAEKFELTQLQTKDVVQKTFDAIVETLLKDGRIELRNFGVFEVKKRKARKARNPRTGDPVFVPSKNVVTFKPGKEMEERVRQMTNVPEEIEDDEPTPIEAAVANNGQEGRDHPAPKKPKPKAKAAKPKATSKAKGKVIP
jgi:integration host factor subunit beta